jgi:hypothetical protein
MSPRECSTHSTRPRRRLDDANAWCTENAVLLPGPARSRSPHEHGGIGERDARDPSTESARIDAEDQHPRMIGLRGTYPLHSETGHVLFATSDGLRNAALFSLSSNAG